MGLLRFVGLTAGAVAAGCVGGTPSENGGNFATAEPRVAIAPDGVEVRVGDSVRMRAWALPPREVATWVWSVTPGDRATIDNGGHLVAGARGDIEVQACANVPKRICGSAPITIR